MVGGRGPKNPCFWGFFEIFSQILRKISNFGVFLGQKPRVSIDFGVKSIGARGLGSLRDPTRLRSGFLGSILFKIDRGSGVKAPSGPNVGGHSGVIFSLGAKSFPRSILGKFDRRRGVFSVFEQNSKQAPCAPLGAKTLVFGVGAPCINAKGSRPPYGARFWAPSGPKHQRGSFRVKRVKFD